MNRFFRLLCVLSLVCISAVAQQRPVHTFSIVARDPATGQIGVAVQSHWFCVGCNSVIWAEPGVGAVATQSFIDPSYGPLGLALMRAGKSAPAALNALLDADVGRDVRQVAMIDPEGNVGSFTGCKDIHAAGGTVGQASGKTVQVRVFSATPPCTTSSKTQIGVDFAVQANLMLSDKVWPAMAKGYEEAKGDLAQRMLAALDAAQAVGGDIRGRQSAALIVVSGDKNAKPWERIFDVRVDDAAEPLKELRRLVQLQRAYSHMNAGDLAVEHKDNDGALREYSEAERIASATPGLLPSRLAEMIYWHAVALVNMGRVDDSLPLFRKCFEMENNWATLTPRLPASGLLPNDPKLIERIVAQAR